MTKIFYQIKIKNDKSFNGWNEIWSDIEEANYKKELISRLKADYGAEIVEKVSAKNPEKIIDYKVFATELTPEREKHWTTTGICYTCDKSYTNKKY